jgi:hypothetical protein
MCQPRRFTTLWASTACSRDSWASGIKSWLSSRNYFLLALSSHLHCRFVWKPVSKVTTSSLTGMQLCISQRRRLILSRINIARWSKKATKISSSHKVAAWSRSLFTSIGASTKSSFMFCKAATWESRILIHFVARFIMDGHSWITSRWRCHFFLLQSRITWYSGVSGWSLTGKPVCSDTTSSWLLSFPSSELWDSSLNWPLNFLPSLPEFATVHGKRIASHTATDTVSVC